MHSSAPIFGFNDARDDIVSTVVSRVVSGTKDALLALNDAAYHETKRLEGSRKPSEVQKLAEWQKLARTVGKMSEAELQDTLRIVVGLALAAALGAAATGAARRRCCA